MNISISFVYDKKTDHLQIEKKYQSIVERTHSGAKLFSDAF